MGCRGPLVQVQSSRPANPRGYETRSRNPFSFRRPPLESSTPIILLCNDDGVRSEGIEALAATLKDIGTVYTVAPDRERSAASHSLTLTHPLRVEKLGLRTYSVDGTPTDCVNLGVNGILKGKKIDLLVSGINKGANLGDDITYSGTVSAAMEGTILGIPSIAFSVVTRSKFRFDVASEFAVTVARKVMDQGLPDDTLLNVNVPNVAKDKISGVRMTRMGKRVYGDVIVEKRDPRGRKYYWIGGDYLTSEEVPGSDLEAIEDNYISITPIHLDLTNYAALRALRKWTW
ncbi:MAG: 5'/3'-nucleotidase SurE [Deltaproteobacteria bacterium]|nr:5'/3'-nucleotidase SurE [Deltaproteobacteria bacterium]